MNDRRAVLLSLAIAAFSCSRQHSDTGAASSGGASAAVPAATGPAAAPRPFPVDWEKSVELAGLNDIARKLDASEPDSFGELQHEGETQRPVSCRQWSDLHAKGFEPTSTLEAQPDMGALLRCGTLSLLQKVQPAQVSFIRDLRWDQSLLPLLPAELATAVSKEQVQAQQTAMSAGQTLPQYESKLVAKPSGEPHALDVVEGDAESVVLLHAEAWGDFNGDAQDDVVVSVINGVMQGSYSTARLLTLTRSGLTEPLKVVSVLH